MSRHRNVRSMRYSDEYDGYDDVYGHSVEEDYSISPSDAAFMYDRSTQQRQICSLLSTEENIAEEDELLSQKPKISSLNEIDKAKLMSCLDEIRNVLGDTLPEQNVLETIIDSNYDITVALDKLLNRSVALHKKDKESPKPQRTTPLRRHERGGRNPNKVASYKMNDETKEDLVEIDKSETYFFDVKEFLSCSSNKDLKLELSEALLRKDTKTQIESDLKIKNTEEKVLTSVEAEDIIESNDKRELVYAFQNMSVKELRKVRPSRLGFFVCKCLTEFNSSYPYMGKRIDLSGTNIIPFQFNCLSPDEEVLSKRKW